MRNWIDSSRGAVAPSRRRQPPHEVLSRPESGPQLDGAATGDAVSSETDGSYCPDCPANGFSVDRKAADTCRAIGAHTRARRQCCGRHLIQRSTARSLERLYRDANGLILMCMYCQWTRRAGSVPEQWDWVETYAVQMPVRVTHGICKRCLRIEV